jgi:hypothetical protein
LTLNEGWAQLYKFQAGKLKWAGHQQMMAWATTKSPKAAASICHAHEFLRQEIKQRLCLSQANGATMIDEPPGAVQCQEEAPDNGTMMQKSAGRRHDA